jgi:hypothetical protein
MTLDPARHTLVAEDLRDLIGEHFPPCISIYLPTHRGGRAGDRLRFQGAVRRARMLLKERYPDVAPEFFAPLEETSDRFLRGFLDGLAVFHSRDTTVAYALPIQVPELVTVADSFHVRPLLHFLQADRHFYLLSLGEKHVDFFRGDAGGLVPRRVPTLPRSLLEVLGPEERQRTISSHSTGSHGNMPMFHGQNKAESAHEEDLARFLRAVDNALWSVLCEEKAPLILAAVERLHPIFHAVTRYAHVTQEGIRGNFETASLGELHRRAWPIIQAYTEADMAEVHHRYRQAVPRGRALDEVRAIAQLAVEGRVWELLLARDAAVWGTLEEGSGDLQLSHWGQQGAEDDVLDDIAEAVLLRGGEVFSFEQDQMPTESPIAAILRW